MVITPERWGSRVQIPPEALLHTPEVFTEYGIHLLREGYAEGTILRRVRILRQLAKQSNLNEPESVKDALSHLNWMNGTKEIACDAYTQFAALHGLTFVRPRYRRQDSLPFIPTESEIDELISNAGTKTSAVLQLLKETGARIGEVLSLKWTEVDTERLVVSIRPEKGSDARQLRITPKCLMMLNRLPHKSERIYPIRADYFRRYFVRYRRQLSELLGNPRLNSIHLHTFRHWKATREYERTRDILYVMRLLGHKNIKNTLIYTRMVSFGNEDFVCRVARTIDECTKLIESGFEYVTELDGTKLFRKRK